MKKHSVIFLSLILVIGIFLVPHVAHAQIPMNVFVDALMLGFSKILMAAANLFIQIAVFLLRFFVLLAGYNGFIEAPVVKFGWSIIRDIANMFFIVILLIIAFGTILGLEQYEWKKALPKLIFAAIFVNFSNVLCQLIIDVAQVFTITFLNAVAGIAGGNFIQMMNFGGLVSFVRTPPSQADGGDFLYQLVMAAMFAVFFTALAMASIGSYLIVMLYRLVVLWTLIIISPLAIIFSVLPSTKGYADEFWKEFINHTISAPVMVFFLWLAFATFGGGQIVQDNIERYNSLSGYSIDKEAEAMGTPTAATPLEASSWYNMANFAVAIAFLLMGIERVQKLGVKGGDYIQRAVDFGKNVATIATGIKAAQWIGGKGMDYGKSGLTAAGKGVLNATGIPHQINKAKEGFKQGWMETPFGKVAARRAGDLATWEHATHAMEERLKAEGHRNSDAHENYARQNVALQNEKRRGDNDQKTLEANVRLKLLGDEKKKFNDLVTDAETAWARANPGKVLDDKTRAGMVDAALDELGDNAATLQALRSEAKSKAIGGKAAKDIDRNMYAELDDNERAKADKILKAKRLAMMMDAKEDMEDFGGESYNSRVKMFKDEHARMVSVRGVAGKEDEYASAQRKVQTLLTVAAENGELSGLMNEVLKHADARVDLTSSGAISGSLVAIQTGRDINDLLSYNAATGKTESNSAIIEAEQRDLRKVMGEKADAKQGILATALNQGAMKKGEFQYYDQMIEGYDDKGRLVRGVYSQVAEAGALPTARTFSTGVSSDGQSIQQGNENFLRQGTTSLNEVKDGRSQIGTNSDGRATAALSPEAEKLLLSISTKTAQEIQRLAPNITNLLSTGTYSKSAWDGAQIRSQVGSEKMLATMKNILKTMKERVAEAHATGTPQDVSRAQDSMVALMQKITGKAMKYSDIQNIDIVDGTGRSEKISAL